MRFMHVIVSGGNCNRHFIINMDQTPVNFSMSSKQTLEVIGTKTIHIRTSTNDIKQEIVAVTITEDSTLLPSTFVFKEKPNGHNATKEFPSGVSSATHFYKCQENAWMDKEVMIAWVNEVLAPYVAMAPDHIVPVLILDMYQCHMMALVVQMIQELGVEPPSCRSLDLH